MPQSLTENYLHIIFSTKHRKPIINGDILGSLHRYIMTVCNNMDCTAINVGGYNDHIHILCRLSKNIALADFLKELKQSSSKWVKTVQPGLSQFYWQDGYGAFSVSNKEIDAIRSYIENQDLHHQTIDFKTELLTIFKEYNINYDERYLWD